MTVLSPLHGYGWNEQTQQFDLNANERFQNNRHARAQARQLFAWRHCDKCGRDYRQTGEPHTCEL